MKAIKVSDRDVISDSYVTFFDVTMAGLRVYKLIEPTASQS
jgi:hypothetical protein